MRWLLASRRRVVLAAAVALAALDGARSVYARIAYAHALTVWDADEYAHIAWPPGVDAPAGASLGARVFARRCALCHGTEGRGNGPAAPSLSPRPRDFTLGEFHYKSTAAGEPATDEDLLRTVRDGLRASAMPYFRDLLGDPELRAVTAHVRSLGPLRQPGEPLSVPSRVPADAASVEGAQALTVFRSHATSLNG